MRETTGAGVLHPQAFPRRHRARDAVCRREHRARRATQIGDLSVREESLKHELVGGVLGRVDGAVPVGLDVRAYACVLPVDATRLSRRSR